MIWYLDQFGKTTGAPFAIQSHKEVEVLLIRKKEKGNLKDKWRLIRMAKEY